jgi:L-lactate dehydrogenase complex protein LldF
MDVRSRDYAARARATLQDKPGVREAVIGATVAFDRHRERAYGEVDSEAWRAWASDVKSHALTNLADYLEEAERRLTENGVVVHWAETAADVHSVLEAVAADHGVRRVVKGKSMLSEELGVNAALERQGIEVVETDLGEYVIQLFGEPPSHILGPAIHRSLEDIQELFHRVHGTPLEATPEDLASAARTALREAFLTADMGITGGNFLVAETGTLALIENEGNIRLTTSAPKVHVALVGIEKVIARWSDLSGMLQLTSRAATGQAVGTFVSMIHGPRRTGEPDGPEAVHVILVDNGRTGMLADESTWEALKCVRCGACLNVCPVYRQTGGHAYGWVYSGPIGAVLAPGLLGLDEGGMLPFASTLCGACTEVCPVRIPLHEMLLTWRRRAVEAGKTPAPEGLLLSVYAAAAKRPALFRLGAAGLRLLPSSVSRRLPFLKPWLAVHGELPWSRPSFMHRWKDGSK